MTAIRDRATFADRLSVARPRQWVKNLLLYAAFLFTAGEVWTLGDPGSWLPLLLRATAGVLLFSALSSAGYFLNDARDADADRAHPRKRERPVARGALAPEAARRDGLVLMVVALVASAALGPWFALAALGYALGTVAYSLGLKDVPVVDVMLVAALFALRAIAGAHAIQVVPSPWLIACAFAGALFVVAVKREQEQRLLGSNAPLHRAVFGIAASRSALRVLPSAAGLATAGLYTAYAATAPNLPGDGSMLLTAPLVAAGLGRYWHAARTNPTRDADEVLLRDPALFVLVGAFVIVSVGLLLRG